MKWISRTFDVWVKVRHKLRRILKEEFDQKRTLILITRTHTRSTPGHVFLFISSVRVWRDSSVKSIGSPILVLAPDPDFRVIQNYLNYPHLTWPLAVVRGRPPEILGLGNQIHGEEVDQELGTGLSSGQHPLIMLKPSSFNLQSYPWPGSPLDNNKYNKLNRNTKNNNN